MNWIPLTQSSQLEEIAKSDKVNIIYKHSTQCPISQMALRHLESNGNQLPDTVPTYYLDTLRYRDLSQEVAEQFEVYHESPQLLVIKNGECVLESSHRDISVPEVLDHL